MGAAQSQETLIWTLVVPSIVAAVSCGFCLVYRYSFNQPIVGEYTAPPPSAAWSRPVGPGGTAEYDAGGGGGGMTKPSTEGRFSSYSLAGPKSIPNPKTLVAQNQGSGGG